MGFTNASSNTFPPTTLQPPYKIWKDWCIGDSLGYLNDNIAYLETLVNTLSSQIVPVGAVQSFAMSTAPTGWLECNGVTVPNGSGTVSGVTANFAALYAAVGSTYGSAGKLPDLRGEFVRGWDNSRGVDSARTFGSSQSDDFKSHSHSYTGSSNTGLVGGGGSAGLFNTSYTTGATGGTETRPRNVALLYCIKY